MYVFSVPKGRRKLAGGASHRIISKKTTSPGGAEDSLLIYLSVPPPLPGRTTMGRNPVACATGCYGLCQAGGVGFCLSKVVHASSVPLEPPRRRAAGFGAAPQLIKVFLVGLVTFPLRGCRCSFELCSSTRSLLSAEGLEFFFGISSRNVSIRVSEEERAAQSNLRA
jgi:hypothetical protein